MKGDTMKNYFIAILVVALFLTACANTGDATRALATPKTTDSYKASKEATPVAERTPIQAPTTITKSIAIGQDLSSGFGSTITSKEFGGLKKLTYTLNGQQMGAYERIYLGDVSVQTGLSFQMNIQDGFEENVFLPISPGGIKYEVELINMPTGVSEANPLIIPFAGENLVIVGYYPNTNKIVVNVNGTNKTYQNGENFIGEDLDDPIWVWDNDLANKKIGIEFDLSLDDDVETENPAYEHPVYLGESYSLPNNYARFKFNALNYPFENGGGPDYNTIQLTSKKDIRIDNGSANVTIPGAIRVLSFFNAGRGLLIDDVITDQVFIYNNPSTGELTLAYKLSSNYNVMSASKMFQVLTDEGVYNIDVWSFRQNYVVENRLAVRLPDYENLFVSLNYGANETTELNYSSGGFSTEITGWESDTRTKYGMVIDNPEYAFSDPIVPLQLTIPEGQVKATISLIGQSGGSFPPPKEDPIPTIQ